MTPPLRTHAHTHIQTRRPSVVLAVLACLLAATTATIAGCTGGSTQPPGATATARATSSGTHITGAPPIDVPQAWSLEADPTSAYGLPKPVGLAPEVKPETRVLTDTEASALRTVEILNAAACVGRRDVEPKCRYRIDLGTLPADVTPGRVLVTQPTRGAPDGFLVRVDSVEGTTVLATEATLGDALAQGEFRVEKAFTAADITESHLADGVRRLTAGGSHTAVGPSLTRLGEAMAFHYGIDAAPTPGVRITGEIHFNAGCGMDGGLTYWHGIPDGAWFDASCGLDHAARLDVAVTAPPAGGKSFELGRERLGTIVFTVGPVPVVIVPWVVVSANIDGTLEVNMAFGAQESVIAKIGVGYHGGFDPYAKFDADSDSHSTLPTGAVDSTVGAEVGVRFMIYGVVGPEFRGFGHVTFRGGPDASPKVCYAIRVAVGASIVLDVGIKSWTWGPWLFIDKTFNQGCRANTPPTVTISSPKEGDTIALGTVLLPQLTAVATDVEDGKLKVGWSSDKDGYLGVGSGSVPGALKTLGPHTLTASTTDADGASVTATVHVTVVAPTWGLTTKVTDLGGQPVIIAGGTVTARQGDGLVVIATPTAGPNQTQPSCAAITWSSATPLQDKGNCVARLTLSSQGTFPVTASLTTPYAAAPITSTVTVVVGPPPATVSPVFEGIVATSATRGVLLDGSVFGRLEEVTLTMRYLNRAQAGTTVTWDWAILKDGGLVQPMPPVTSTADGSSMTFSSSEFKNSHTYVFRCVITPSGGGPSTTRSITLRYLGPPA